MSILNDIVRYIKSLPPAFYGQIVIKLQNGRIVLWESHRTFKPIEDKDGSTVSRD